MVRKMHIDFNLSPSPGPPNHTNGNGHGETGARPRHDTHGTATDTTPQDGTGCQGSTVQYPCGQCAVVFDVSYPTDVKSIL